MHTPLNPRHSAALLSMFLIWTLVCQAMVLGAPHCWRAPGEPAHQPVTLPDPLPDTHTGAAISGLTIFGPRRFDRTTGPPNQYLEQFSLPEGATSPYVLHIQNGGVDGTNRVSSATVELNGTSVLAPSDLNQHVANVDRTVSLGSTNRLDVELASTPGSYLIIDISSPTPASDTTPPLLVITSPDNNTTTTNNSIAISGTAIDPGAGASGVAHVYVNGLEATLNASDSTWVLAALPLVMGANEIIVRAVDHAGNQTTASIAITRAAPNQAPTINAGIDQTITLPDSANLNGAVSDDGLPAGAALTTTWTRLSGPGEVSFGDSAVTVTNASFSQPGMYVLRLMANDSELTGSDDVTIIVLASRVPPSADFLVPESTGTAGAFVIDYSSFTGSAFSADKILDSEPGTYWNTQGVTGQFAKIQFFDQNMVFIDRVRLQPAQGSVSSSTLKDFEVQISSTTADDASFSTVLSATLLNNGQLQEFVLPGGPRHALYLKLIARNNYGDASGIQLGTFNPLAVGSADGLISLPARNNVALCQSPALLPNGAAIYDSSYPGGASSANTLAGYFEGGWQTSNTANQFATIQLAGQKSYTLEGIRLATWYDSGAGLGTAVKDFEVWSSNTTPDDVSFTRVLSARAAFVPYAQQFSFPGGPVQARYVKYMPLNNWGAGTTINTQAFDVIAEGTARVVAVSGESGNFPNSAQAAFDGNPATNWFGPTGTVNDVWVKTALANDATQRIYGVRVLPFSQLEPKDFDIRVSTTTTDDSAFTTVYSGTLAPSFNSPAQEFLFNFVDARYVQFYWKDSYNPSLVGIKELEVLAAPERGSGIVGFSSQADPLEAPANALDIDPNDQEWVTASGQNTNQWLKLLLPRAQLWTINHIALRPGLTSNDLNRSPKDFELQVSPTDAADSSFTTVLNGTLANSSQLQDFYFPDAPARYVRLLLKNNYGSAQIGLSSFYIYSRDLIGTNTRFMDRSLDPDGQIVSWSWDFGDGAASVERNPAHTFSAPGDYTVTLMVTDDSGLQSTRQAIYHVAPTLLPDFTYSPVMAHEAGEAIRFTDITPLLVGPTAIRQYDFGDGSTVTQGENTSTHTFQDNGTFHVSLKIGDGLGVAHSITKDIVVLNVPPSVDIDPGKTLVWGEEWTSVPRIAEQSPIDRASLRGEWNLGDGQTLQCVNCTNANATVTHAYSKPGTYTAVLTVTDKDGGAGSDSTSFIVNKRPTALVLQTPPAQTAGQPLVLHAELRDTFANQTLTGKPVQFTLNGATFNALTGSAGVAEISVPLPVGTKIDVITASFAGDNFYLSCAGATVPPTAGAAPPSVTSGNQGTDFWLMFPSNYFGGGLSVQKLFITSPVTNTGTVAIPGFNFAQTFTVQANTVVTVVLPFVQVTDSDLVQAKGINVTSQLPVSVYGMNQHGFTSDAFLGLPVNSLGLDHYVLTYGNMPFSPSSEVGIVGTENDTTVTITPTVTTGTRVGGVPYTVTLNQGQTYLLQNIVPTADGDLSGSHITSNKPIAVFSGHMAATIPAEALCCADHLVEQLPPIPAWGKRFATVPLATRTKGDFFRFIAAEDGTAIYLNGSLTAVLNRGQFTERILKDPAEIIATGPIMVAQYSTSIYFDNGTTGKGDPFFMIIPPYSQFLNHYTITTPPTGFDINYANVVAPTAMLGNITLDGAAIPWSSFSSIGVSGFSGAQVPLSVGAHTLDGPAGFGVFVYGYAQDEGYGYPGGMNMTPAIESISINVSPEVSTHAINTEGCIVATVNDQNQIPLGGRTINFTVTGANPSSSSAETNAAGQATLCYTGTNLGTDQIAAALESIQSTRTIVWTPPNQPPVVSAGSDRTITLPAIADLQGTVTDDGLPSNTLIVSWSMVSGPCTVAFGNTSTATTTATFDAAGIYVLRLTASDALLSTSDDVQITVNATQVNQAPTANAGADQTVTLNANLIVNPGNEEALAGGEIVGWTSAEGTNWTQAMANSGSGFPDAQHGNAYFFAGNAPQAELRQDVDVSTFAANIAAGTKQFEFKAYLRSAAESTPDAARVIVEYRDATNTNVIATLDSGLISSTSSWHLTEDTRIAPPGTGWIRVRLLATRHSGSTNDAFFDSISLRPVGGAAVPLRGAITDDGLPAGSMVSAHWTEISGPATVTFTNAGAADSAALFATAGFYVLRLTASDGQLSASDDVIVSVNPANLPPIANAGANQTITLPSSATLNGSTSDDGQPSASSLSAIWTKVSGPGTVTFANASVPTTTADFSAAGTYVLRLTADDNEYSNSADVIITVSPAAVPSNQTPTVNAGADQTITLPADTVSLNGIAADDGLPMGSSLSVSWTTITAPAPVILANANSAATTAQFTMAGTYVLRLTATDGELSAIDDITITVIPGNQAPNTNAGPDQTILLSQAAQLNGSASDDGLPSGNNLTTNWTVVNGPGAVTFTNPNVTVTGAQFTAIGTYVLRLTASDGQLDTSDDISVTVIDNVPLPTVEITSPSDGDELTAPAIVTGSVSNGSWTLEYSLKTDDDAANQVWTELATGDGPVINGPLGSLDTTLMLNGIYVLRLRATDSYSQTSFTSISILVDKNFKVGQFQIAFSDLNVPVAGLPIEVIRSYDSRDKRVGDFGVGWSLGLRNARVEKTEVLGFSWHETVSSGSIPTYCLEPGRPHKVTITFGDGKVFKFLASTAIHCQQFVPVTSTLLTFTPEPGTHAALEVMGPSDVLVETQGSLPGPVRLLNQNNPDIFNSGTFRLTTAEGASYVIDQHAGVRSLRDSYGNTLTIDDGGIVHSSGQSIAFTRDAAGRITQITDPNGNAQIYSYDTNGDLAGFTDRENQTTTYSYNSDHHLLTITDARGTTPLQNQFDESGRLIGQTDAFNRTLAYDHDIVGRVETITDRLGQQTRYEYDERGNVLRQVDAKGVVRSFTYDALDNVLSETNALGKTTTYTYDAADNRASITDPLGNITRFTYNSARQVLTVTDALNHVTTNTYDAAGTNLLTSTDPLGNTTSYTYSVFTGQRITMNDALNNATHHAYDGNGRLGSETDALGHITNYTYDANGNRRSQTVTRTNAQDQPETIATSYEYDRLNRPVKTIYADGSFTQTEYNAIGQQSATIDQMGHRTEFVYDEMGRVTRTDYPDGTREETTFDAEGHRLTSRDRAGHVTSYTYDELGRLTKTTYADGSFTTTTYDAAGQVLTTADPRGNVTRYVYDDAGRRTKVSNALNQQTTFAFDANGNQLSVTDALGRTTSFEYDANSRRTKTIYADNTFDSVAYDALGRTVSKTDQAGKTTQFAYDALGRLTKVKDALNQETTYTYDEIGQQLSQTDASGHTTRFEYDQLGRRVKRILPRGETETYAYDDGGNLQSKTDFNGKLTTFTYDVMRRLRSKVPDASLNQPTISFTYNANGQRSVMTDASGETTYAYDLRNRLASKQTPFGNLSYTYDESGNLLTTHSSNAHGASVDYNYDALNRLDRVKDNNMAALNGGLTSYSYDNVGNLQSYLYPNGVRTVYDYNSLNRLTTMTVGTPALILASYAYTLSPAGNRTAVTELNNRTVSYTYDDLYRLTSETIANDSHGNNGAVSYSYDPVGNRLSRASTIGPVPSQSSTYDANNRLTSDNYDNNGNTTSASGNSYAYDFENHLSSFTTPGSASITFVYDGDGNRVAKTVNGITTNYLVDTNNPTGYAQVVEELHAGIVTKQFTYGHDLISQSTCLLPSASCHPVFYGYDGHGSVRLLTDATGAVTDTYDYDAFGNLISRSGTTSNDYLYSGEQFDATLGFYYLRARYMNPASGRFWTMDSFEGGSYDPASLHKYVYASNNGANRIDSSGHIGVGDMIGEVYALGWRVRLFAMDFPRALAAGKLLLGAFNVASFFGDHETRDLVITAAGPLGTAELLTESVFSISRGVLSAGFTTSSGLSRSAVISAERANQILVNRLGLSVESADSYVASFEGPVTARIAEPGNQWPRYTGNPSSEGSFLADELFGNPEQAMDALNIRLYGNPATFRQTVTATGRSIVLEGAIKGSIPPGVRQTVITDRSKFEFSIGEKY